MDFIVLKPKLRGQENFFCSSTKWGNKLSIINITTFMFVVVNLFRVFFLPPPNAKQCPIKCVFSRVALTGQAGTSCGESAKADLIQNFILTCIYIYVVNSCNKKMCFQILCVPHWGLRIEYRGLRIEDQGLRIKVWGPMTKDWGLKIGDWGLTEDWGQPFILWGLKIPQKLTKLSQAALYNLFQPGFKP